MKKTLRMLTVFCVMIAVLMGSSMAVFAANGTISKTKAKQIALEEANVKSSSVKEWIKVKLDDFDDDDDKEWEIKFQTSRYKYDVEINARTGRVKDFEKKKINSNSAKYIGTDKAKSIALNHAKKKINITGNVRYAKAKLDRDDGYVCYEVEFTYENWEFEYKIHAKTGKILEWDQEYDDYDD